jgi:hypothetical protein
MFFLQKNQRTRGWKRFFQRWWRGELGREVAQIMYAHVSKCKKIKVN